MRPCLQKISKVGPILNTLKSSRILKTFLLTGFMKQLLKKPLRSWVRTNGLGGERISRTYWAEGFRVEAHRKKKNLESLNV